MSRRHWWVASAAAALVLFGNAPATGKKPGEGPEVVARKQRKPTSIALDSAAVYWSAGERWLRRYRFSEHRAEDFYTSEGTSTLVAIDASTVFWFDFTHGLLASMSKARSEPNIEGARFSGKKLWNAPIDGYVTAMTVDGEAVYALYSGSFSAAYRVPKDGGEAKEIARGSGFGIPWSIAVDDKYIYWTNILSPSIWRAPKDGEHVKAEAWLPDRHSPRGIVTDAQSVCWTDHNLDGYVTCHDKKSGAERTLAEKQLWPGAMTIDNTYIYWVNNGNRPESDDPDVKPETLPVTDGSVMMVPRAGGTPIVLARRQNKPVALAVDKDYVYWVNEKGGTVMRVRKPPSGAVEKEAPKKMP